MTCRRQKLLVALNKKSIHPYKLLKDISAGLNYLKRHYSSYILFCIYQGYFLAGENAIHEIVEVSSLVFITLWPRSINIARYTRNDTLECYFCKGRHWIAKCSRFHQMAVQKRRALMQSTGACRRCFSTGHPAADCRRQRPTAVPRSTTCCYTRTHRPATSGVMSML